MPHRYGDIDFKRTFDSLDTETKEFCRKQGERQNERDFKSLCDGLNNGTCYLCGKPLEDYSEPCFHWLLNPTIKKNVLRRLFATPVSFIHLYTYLTWVANSETPFVNVNDLMSDVSKGKMFEASIKYREFTWSFSFGGTDFEALHYGKSHYHLEIRKNDNVIVRFGDFHIEFTPYDYLMFEMISQGAVSIDAGHSAGIESLCRGGIPEVFSSGITIPTRTFILPSSCSDSQLSEIMELKEKTGMGIVDIIDKLNSEKGYSIKYAQCVHPDYMLEKIHRK